MKTHAVQYWFTMLDIVLKHTSIMHICSWKLKDEISEMKPFAVLAIFLDISGCGWQLLQPLKERNSEPSATGCFPLRGSGSRTSKWNRGQVLDLNLFSLKAFNNWLETQWYSKRKVSCSWLKHALKPWPRWYTLADHGWRVLCKIAPKRWKWPERPSWVSWKHRSQQAHPLTSPIWTSGLFQQDVFDGRHGLTARDLFSSPTWVVPYGFAKIRETTRVDQVRQVNIHGHLPSGGWLYSPANGHLDPPAASGHPPPDWILGSFWTMEWFCGALLLQATTTGIHDIEFTVDVGQKTHNNCHNTGGIIENDQGMIVYGFWYHTCRSMTPRYSWLSHSYRWRSTKQFCRTMKLEWDKQWL